MIDSAVWSSWSSEVVDFFQGINLDIQKEIIQQNQKWGIQNHSFADWAIILGEEFGEVCTEIINFRLGSGIEEKQKAVELLDKELIQVISVCVRILEKIRLNNVNS